MQKTTKAFLIAVLLLVPAHIFAQFNNNSSSPYSRYGMGDLQPITFGRAAGMGQAIIGSRNSQQINITNPASYTSIDSMAFLFEFGFTGKVSNYKNSVSSFKTNNANFSYFAFSFPITRWLASSMGLTPYSDSGYDVQLFDEVESEGIIWQHYYGEGSLSRAFIGFGVEPVKNISIGANFFYFFGTQTRNAEMVFIESNDTYNNSRYEQIRLRDFGVNLGIQATLPLKQGQTLTLGATIENKPKFTAFQTDFAQKSLSNGTSTDVDTIRFIDKGQGIIQMPLTIGLGVSYTKKDKLELNADYYHQNWSKATFFGTTNQFLTDLDRFSIGAELIPDKFSIRSYLKRIAYRGGLKYEKSYLMIGNEQIKDFGISFGVGLPVYRSLSTINISAEIGQRGTTDFNLIKEQYAKLTLNVNLHDIWFVKRKFD